MPRQMYPASGTRYGNHPGVNGYPVSGSRYGSHPGSSVVPPSLPTNNLLANWDAEQGITLSSTMVGYGGATPLPTLGGVLGAGDTVLAKCRTAGDEVTATWNISFDGGATFPVHDVSIWIVAGLVTSPGVVTAPSGLTITFPTGSYLQSALYVSRAASWLDATGTYTASVDGANNPPIVTAW
jgi:hypothetical protein